MEPLHPRASVSGIAAVLVCAAVLGGCASSPRFTTHPDRARTPAAEPADAPRVEPSPEAAADESHSLLMTEGLASYYADDFNGKKTANGEIFDMYALTAAHRSLPFGTKLRVTNLDNNRTVIVRVNDRGPFKMERIIDLSLGAAAQLQMMGVGVARVRLDVLEWGDGLYVKTP
ncbi:MAG: septal ring lytic transglycosylase RlpA family protein [Acidobacteriota bacterium]